MTRTQAAALRNGESYSKLECPLCDGSWLHQRSVDVYRRVEDSDNPVHASVSVDGSVVDESNDGNPSSRRSGIRIFYECEQCHAAGEDEPDISLCIAQHKGNERFYWEIEE